MKQSDFRKPPVAQVKTEVLEKFGIKREDNYFWLKEKENKEVIDYLNEENAYTSEVMKDTEELQKTLYDEILGRIKEDDESYPYLSNGYYYYQRTTKGQQYPVICRRKGSIDASEEVLFDVNKLAEGHEAFIVSGYKVSPDNKKVAYLYNTTGSFAEFTLKIRNLETGEDEKLAIDGVSFVEWANDSKTLLYVKIDDALRPSKLYIKDSSVADESDAKMVYEEEDARFYFVLEKDLINESLIASSISITTSEVRLISAENPYDEPAVMFEREKDVEYMIAVHKDYYFMLYKDKQNPNKKIVRLPKEGYQDKSTWVDVVEHDENAKIEDIHVLSGFMIWQERRNGLEKISIMDLSTFEKLDDIAFPEEAYSAYLGANKVYEADTIRYIYSSLKRPTTVYEYSIPEKKSIERKVQEIPSGFDPEDYVLERLWATSHDGVKVPMAVIYKKGLKKDGSNPALLYAYGSYGASALLGFRGSVFSLVDRGFVYAEAQIRGGSDMGEFWYEDGKFLKKKNTFKDFIACGEYLVDEKYTSSERLSIEGGSAGGLLMGAVTNMRPDLFHSVVSKVPFVDVVTTMLDETLPLTVGEYEEWGNPNEEEYFKYILSYSPYDNLEKKDYPHMLVTGGLNDSQVRYHEPAKYVAKLRTLKTDNNILLLHMNMKSGHGGGTGRYDRIKDTALDYAFMLAMLGK